MLEGKELNRHHQENHCFNSLTLIYMAVFYLHFSSCHSDLGKSCPCCDQWWFLIFFNSPAYRLLLSRRSGGLLSIVFITICDPLKSRENLTRLCTSMEGKDQPSSTSTLKRGLREPVWVMSNSAVQPWCPDKPQQWYPCFLCSTSEEGWQFCEGNCSPWSEVCTCCGARGPAQAGEGNEPFWLWPAVIYHPVTFLHLQLI